MRKVLVGLFILPMAMVAACGNGKEGSAVKQKAATPAVAMPAQPSGISTLASDGQVEVRWGAVAGSDTYNVYFSEKAGAPKEEAAKVAGIKEPSYAHKDLKNSATYYYRVSAVNKAGEGALSAETAAMPKSAPPPIPAGVAAMGGTGKITVKWEPVKGADSYNVYFSAKPQVEKSKRTKISGVKQPPYDHADVKKKTMYFYVVSAVNAGGESPISGESGAMP